MKVVKMGDRTYSYNSLFSLMDSYEIISFDVFDTLLCRTLARPTDVFKYIELSEGIKEFSLKRVRAEKNAREIIKKRSNISGAVEVTFSNIYEDFSDNSKKIKDFMSLELKAESLFLNKNEFFFNLYKYARKKHKRVIAISDMYLSKTQINKFLIDNSIFVDELYVSSEFTDENIGKFNSKIYPHVLDAEKITKDKILHFGDNELSDFRNAMACGICAVHQNSITTDLFTSSQINQHSVYLADKNNTYTSSVIIGALANRFFNNQSQIAQSSELYKFGYFYGGVLVAAFSKFILSQAQKDEVKHLYLLARDGCIIQNTFDLFGVDEGLSYEILPASRRMLIFPLLAKSSDWARDTLFPENKLYRPHKVLSELGFSINDFNCNHVQRCELTREEFLEAFYEQLKLIAKLEYNSLLSYLTEKMHDLEKKNVAIVDVGWGLSSHKAIDELLNDRLFGYYVGTRRHAYNNGKVRSLLFSSGMPSKIADPIMGAVELIELIFSDVSSSAVCLSKENNNYEVKYFQKNNIEKHRDLAILEVRQGVNDFLKDIAPHFKLLDLGDLEAIASDILVNIALHPTDEEFVSIGSIMHPREIGQVGHLPISHWWKTAEQKLSDNFHKANSNGKLPVQKKLIRETTRVAKQAQNLFRWRA